MSSVTENHPSESTPVEAVPAEARFVDEQIRRTRRALKLVDFTAGVITLVIGVLAYLLTLAVLEHWVVPGGWSPQARATLFVGLVGGSGWFCWRIFWPLLSKPINPAFAAKTIEQSSPSLKNSLLNLLLLRERRRQISRQLYQAIEQQAAQRLAEVPLDSVIDRSAILRLGYVLVAVVALCALYRVLSPKDPLASAGRLLMPWSNIPVPSRVQILDVQPGDTSAARGEQLAITAEILGTAEDEPVRLRYSANDEQIVGQEVLMTPQKGGLRFDGRLPGRVALGGSGGIQNDLTYWIEAGDARSSRYKVTVFSQPTLVVEKIRYEYPTYTRYIPREVENTGDIAAVEGTIVTITAVANQPIESAHVDFDADGRHDLLMKSEDRQATVSFPLELRDDRRTPRYQSYVLRYTTAEGRKNPAPPKYRIEVERDYGPEIELVSPEQEVLDVGLHDEVPIEVEARDPDFAVHNVAILGDVAGERVLKESLLSVDHTGRFVGQFKLVPAELNLKPGDVLEYWGAAADNRRPEPNLAFTGHHKLRIVGPNDQGGQQQGERGEGQGNEGAGQQGEDGEQGEEGQAGGAGPGDQQADSDDQQGEGKGEDGVGQQSDAQGENGEKQPGLNGESADGSEESQDDSQGEAGGNSPAEDDESGEAQENSESSQDNSGGKPAAGEGKVSPEGDDDGTAFERIAKHFEEQKGDSEGSEGEASEQQDSARAGETASGEQADSGDEGAEKGDTKGAEGDAALQQEQGGREDDEQQDNSTDPGGEMQEHQGPAGAGENPGENEGSPDPLGKKRPNDKPTDDAGETEQNDQEAPAQGEGQHESDSQGAQGGDRSGGGQEGGGQKADEEGTGGAGENQAAEDGAGQAAEPGDGEAGAEAGGEEKAPGETGESSGDEPGQGGEQGDQPGQQPGGDQDASGEQQPGESPSDPGPAGGQPQTGGTGGSSSTPPPGGETAPGDEANLNYTRQQTDLVLDKLEDQLRKQEVDQELLEKLGWSADELRRFAERWKNLKSLAEGTGPQAEDAQKELDDALRSLGLERKRGPGFQSQTAKDKLRDLQDAYRGRTPLEYQELLRKYVKGTATAQEK